MIKKLKTYCLWEKDSLEITKTYIDEQNRSTLIMLLSAMVFAYASLFIAGMIKLGYSAYQYIFAFMLAYMLVCLFLVIKIPSLPARYLLYGVYIVTVLVCLYASSFVDPDYVNAEAYILFLLFPIMCVDHSIKINSVSIILTIMYIYTIMDYKSGKALSLEASTIIGFSLLGMFIGNFSRYRLLKNRLRIEQCEKAELREALMNLPNHRSFINDISTLPTSFQAVVFIKIDELYNPVLSFGIHYDEEQMRKLGIALAAAAAEQGINLYCCGSGIIGLMQPRMLEGVFQRLESLHHILNNFKFRKNDGEMVKLHFGIGASDCGDSIDAALQRATDACAIAQKEGKNRIQIQDR